MQETEKEPIKVDIRLAKESDLVRLGEVYSSVYDVFDVGEKWTPETAKKLMEYWLKRQPDLFFVAEEGEQILGGFVAGIQPWWDGNHLVDGEIFVDPDYQGKGIGSRLSRTMFETAIDRYNASVWDTYTFKGPKHPLSWYKQMGFEEIEDWTMISGDIRKALKRIEEK